MPKLTIDTAALIGVVAAIIAAWFYALGTVAHLSYFNALGFDGHQFPALDYELYVTGFAYGVLPALSVGVIALLYACLFAFANRAEAWLSRHPATAKWRIPIALLISAAGVVWSIFFSPPATLTQWIVGGIIVGAIVLGAVLLWKWVPNVGMGCFIGAIMLVVTIKIVSGQAYEAGQKRADEIEQNQATTIVELANGSKFTAPGVRIACSERFCGFHDGKTATVISMDNVRSIQSPTQQQKQPSTQPDAAERAPAAAGAPDPAK